MGGSNSRGYDEELKEKLPESMIPGLKTTSFSPALLNMAFDVIQGQAGV